MPQSAASATTAYFSPFPLGRGAGGVGSLPPLLLPIFLLACTPAAPGVPNAPAASPKPGAGAPITSGPPARLGVAVGSVGGSSLPMWIAKESGVFEERNLT